MICLTELGCTDPTGWVIVDYPDIVCPWCIKEGKYMVEKNE